MMRKPTSPLDYPQLYSRVGFVHEFQPLERDEMRELLKQQWCPPSVALPVDALTNADGIVAIMRATGGNFRLLNRLLTEIARVLDINQLQQITPVVVEAARESHVIGQLILNYYVRGQKRTPFTDEESTPFVGEVDNF